MGGDSSPTPAATRDFAQQFPEILKTTARGIPEIESAILQATRSAAPQYAALQNLLYGIYGPKLAATGSEVARQSALSEAQTTADVLRGPGGQVISAYREAAGKVDPEFFAGRELAGNKLAELLGSTNVSPGLSGGERAEIERSVNRQNVGRGLIDVPSATSTAANALQFGRGAQDSLERKQFALGQALGVATGFLPVSRTGVDPLQQATGKSSFPNIGETRFANVQPLGQGAGVSGNLASSIYPAMLDAEAGRRDTLDRATQVMSSMPSVS